ncbi:MAG TPA: BlaI/MecI/CopY family transcriptional regulator [Verrucomicrobiae bacterium]|nr:BlaI/MecI/CopY family transcriptional regulator [Verrucomicrobiae bacterium]
MTRKASLTLTDAELRIMRVLWARGESTNMDIVGAITDPPLARNTVMTTLGVLERKGYVEHRIDGRTFIYSAVVPEDRAKGTALESVLRRFFDGSAEQLVVKLLDADYISNADRKRIQKLVDEAVDE